MLYFPLTKFLSSIFTKLIALQVGEMRRTRRVIERITNRLREKNFHTIQSMHSMFLSTYWFSISFLSAVGTVSGAVFIPFCLKLRILINIMIGRGSSYSESCSSSPSSCSKSEERRGISSTLLISPKRLNHLWQVPSSHLRGIHSILLFLSALTITI